MSEVVETQAEPDDEQQESSPEEGGVEDWTEVGLFVAEGRFRPHFQLFLLLWTQVLLASVAIHHQVHHFEGFFVSFLGKQKARGFSDEEGQKQHHDSRDARTEHHHPPIAIGVVFEESLRQTDAIDLANRTEEVDDQDSLALILLRGKFCEVSGSNGEGWPTGETVEKPAEDQPLVWVDEEEESGDDELENRSEDDDGLSADSIGDLTADKGTDSQPDVEEGGEEGCVVGGEFPWVLEDGILEGG